MKKILSGTVLLLMLSANVTGYARQLGLKEASELAGDFASKVSENIAGSRGVSREVRLVYSAMAVDAADETAYYVFDYGSNEGYVIVSGDDRLRPVLGYSTSGRFEMASLPSNMRWWLGEYQREISAFLQNGIGDGVEFRREERVRDVAPRSAIEPMVSTKWSQTSPYNDRCPSTGGRKSVTGCVATAMAQIVNYHQWPQGAGTGSYSYIPPGMSGKVQFNYAANSFAWSNMLDDYSTGKPTLTQKMAVADLMLACGVGVHMKYSPNESGAYSMAVPYALISYLKYDSGTRMLMRDYYYTSEWENIIYDELSSGRPVLYSGANKEGAGHAFVCDGYAGNGFFHMNWGWGGYYDDYFALSALNPDGQGTGGNIGGFNYGQDMIIGIKPSAVTGKSNGLILSGGGFTYADAKFSIADGIFNYYPQAFEGEVGVEVVSEGDTGSGLFVSAGKLKWNAADISNGSLPGFNIGLPASLVKGLKPGNYRIYPAWQGIASRWERMLCPVSEQCFVTLAVASDNTYIYSNEGPVTGVEEIVSDDEFEIYARASAVIVAGADVGAEVEVYDLRGVRVGLAKATAGETAITLVPGIYIVRCGLHAKKVVVE